MALTPNISAAPGIGHANYLQRQQNALAASTSTTSKNDGILSDGIMKKLLETGLNNDVDHLLNKMHVLETTDYSLGLDSQKKDLYEVYSLVNKVIQSGEQMKKAEEKALSNNSLDSIAIDNHGYIFTFDGKKIGKTAISKYNAEKERALTVGELIQHRKENPEFAFDNTMLSTIANIPGQEQIQNYIGSIIDKIGSATDTTEAYQNISSMLQDRAAKKPTQQELYAIQEIAAIADKEGIQSALFKVKNSESSKNLQLGLNYLLKTLPSKFVNQLRAQYVVNYGGSFDKSGDYVVDMLSTTLDARNTTTNIYEEQYASELNNGMGTDSAKTIASKDKVRSMTTMENFFNQSLNWVEEGIQISFPEYRNQLELKVQGTKIPQLVKDDGSATVGRGPLRTLLESDGKGMGKHLDMSNTYLGTDKVYSQQLNNVFYNNAEVANVWMPVDDNGNIDWASMTAFSEAEDEIKRNNITNPVEKNNIHYKYNSPAVYDPVTGEYKNGKVAQFLYTVGYTIDDNLSSSNNMYRELYGDEEELVDDELETVYEQFKTEFGNKQKWDDIYQVPVFVKIKDNSNINSSYYGKQGSIVPHYTIQQDKAIQAANQQPVTPIYSSASALYQE